MDDLRRAIVAWRVWRTPATVLRELRDGGVERLDDLWNRLPATSQDEIRAESEHLEEAGVRAWLLGDSDYPAGPALLKSPPPVLFGMGNAELLSRRSIGVCGSRAASNASLQAAGALGRTIAGHGDVLVAGNAQGVDAEAQGAALEAAGAVISVLPEGVTHFRLRTGSTDAEPGQDQLLVLSPFPPRMPWSVGGAMSRNELIVALSVALVVVEAGQRGGTLAAGDAALKQGRPVIALEYGDEMPAGNALLIRRGARPARSLGDVYGLIEAVPVRAHQQDEIAAQLPLAF